MNAWLFAEPQQPIQHQILVKKVLQHKAKVVEKMQSTNFKTVKKMGAKNLQNRAPTPSIRAQKAPREGLGSLLGRLVATLKTKLDPSSVWEASWGGSGRPLGSS